MKIAVILGTRPEIIKMSPVVKELQRSGADFFILHTGQHYSYELDRVFFEQLQLPEPRFQMDTGSGPHGESTGRMLMGIEKILLEERPGIVLAEGDTNSVLAGTLAAAKLGIAVGHIEAGLRSYDRAMPEEINRVVADHVADILFAPTASAEKILLGEGIEKSRIFVTGNTIVDAVKQNLALAETVASGLRNPGLEPKKYLLVTLHRQENVDSRDRFAAILEGIGKVSRELGLPALYPIHPRAKKMTAEFGLVPAGIDIGEPVDYLDFLRLEKNARLILTDSGGVQEEACILGVPCVTLRDNTERPETVEVGANMLAGTRPEVILECTRAMLNKDGGWPNPFGDGRAGEKIVGIVREAGYG